MKRLAALAIGILLALALAEGGFRLAGIRPPDPRLHREGPVHLRAEKNQLGFHDYEWRLEREPGVHRSIVLGDSFTMGRRVPRDELFVKHVERSLNQRAAGRRRYEIYNLSHFGWDTVDELEALKEIGLRYRPDSVVVVFYVNDATGLDSNPLVVARIHRELSQRDGWPNRLSRAYDYVDYAIRRRRISRLTVQDYRASFLGSQERQAQWARAKGALAELQRLSHQHGFRLGLVVFPMLVRLDDSHELADVYRLVEEACAELSIPTLGLLPTFLGHDEASLWVSPVNAHPNTAANRLAAPPIEAFMIREGLVPDPDPE